MSKILDGIVLIKKQLKIWLSVARQHATNFNWGQFHFLLRGQDKKNPCNPADIVSSVYQPERVRQWNQPQHKPNSVPSYCTQPAFTNEINPVGARKPIHKEHQLSSSGNPPAPEALSVRLSGWLLHAAFLYRIFHTNLLLISILRCFFLFHFLLVSPVVHVFLFGGLQQRLGGIPLIKFSNRFKNYSHTYTDSIFQVAVMAKH